MATIVLYANEINQMPGILNEVKKSVIDYKSELLAIKMKSLTIDRGICNLDDVISSIQSSTQIQDKKITSLESVYQNTECFIQEVVCVDGKVADIVRQRQDEFYGKYIYLKPDCEKEWLEQARDWFVSAKDWCKEHWKAVVTIVIVVGSVVGVILCPVATPLFVVARDALIGVMAGGALGGLTSVAFGGPFWEGVEDGAFTGAIYALLGAKIGYHFTGVGEGAKLTLSQCIFTGMISGASTQIISDTGDIFLKKKKISIRREISNVLIAGGVGGVLGASKYGMAKVWKLLKFENNSRGGSNSNTGVGNPVKIEGRGSTGRTVPNNLEEQMAMHQVQSNPLEGAFELPIKLSDMRWKLSDGWVKMQSVIKTEDGNRIIIHYVYNKITGAFDDFKFK